MIKFIPDIQFLFCLSWPIKRIAETRNYRAHPFRFPLNVSKLPCGTFSLNVLDNELVQDPWNYESSSKGGFLMGDPLFYRVSLSVSSNSLPFAFVLNKQSVLRVVRGKRKITMLKHEDYLRDTWRPDLFSRPCTIAFALDGKTIYGTTEGYSCLLYTSDAADE